MTVVLGKSTTDFSNIRTSRSDEKINDLVLWFIWLFLARFVFSYIANVLVGIAATRTTRSLRRSFLESTLRQETWYFDKIHGSTATLVTTNATRVQNGIGEKLTAFVQGLSTFFAAFVVALAVQWKLALISMSLVPLLFLLVGGCVSIDAKLEARVMRIYSRAAMLAQDTLGSIRTIHAFGAQAKITRKYDEFLQVAHEEGKKKSVVFGVLFSSEIFLALSSTSLSFWQGYRMFRSNEIPDSGTVFTVALATSIGTLALSLLAPQQQAMSNAASAASELFATIKKKSLLDPLSESGLQPSSCRGQIEVEDLSFVYPQRPAVQVLDHLTISIPAGKTTALVGPSGCGKSTIVALLERWYASNPGTGRITLDGVNLEQYNTKWLRNQIGLVQQEPTLFRGTVFENVAKGFVAAQRDLPREAQMKLVEAACRDSNAHDFITRLPQAYDTQVGERASMLSGGERQRLAIARSIISEPRILLLDEATSALDPAAERLVQSALDRVSVGKTTLIIAHKLATVKAADNIAVMQRGRVVEQGTHEQLIALGGIYATMVRAQDIGAGANDVVRIDHNSESHTDENEKIPVHDPTQAPVLEVAQEEMGRPVTSSLGYSLPKCIGIMLREHRKVFGSFVLNTLGCLIAGGTYPAQAILFSKLIRAFTLPEAEGRAKFFALMFFLMAIANLLAYFVLGWTCNTIGQEVTHKYRAELVECMLDLDMDFFDKPENSVGSLTSRLSSVPTALQELMASNLHLMFVVLVNLVSSSVLGIVYGWRLGLVLVFGGLPVLLGSGYLRIRLDQRFQDDEAGRFAESAGLATEAITSIRTISSLTLEADVLDQYVHSVDQIVERATKYFLIAMIPYALSQSLEFLIFALGLWYGQKLILEDGYTTEQFWVVFIAVVFGGMLQKDAPRASESS
jgi:ATP-binding cassette subfamily B (MDR/TAP) protein 1